MAPDSLIPSMERHAFYFCMFHPTQPSSSATNTTQATFGYLSEIKCKKILTPLYTQTQKKGASARHTRLFFHFFSFWKCIFHFASHIFISINHFPHEHKGMYAFV
jgi:hypothetical protein